MAILNVKQIKRCAFCTYWYDPGNSHIRPKTPTCNMWEYDFSAKCKCIKRGTDMLATSSCNKYECKVPLN